MKKAILFYTNYDKGIEENIPNLKKYLEKNGYEFKESKIDDDPLLATEKNVMVSPVLIIFEKSKEIKRLVGNPKSILKHLKQNEL